MPSERDFIAGIQTPKVRDMAMLRFHFGIFLHSHSMTRPSGPICVGASRARFVINSVLKIPVNAENFFDESMHAPNSERIICECTVAPRLIVACRPSAI